MRITSHFIRERKHYTFTELQSIFNNLDEDKLWKVISNLREANVLKEISGNQRNLSDLDALEYDPEDNNSYLAEKIYLIKFVGVISVSGHVLKCLPKYLLHELTEEKKNKHLEKIFQVLIKYNNTKDQQTLMTLSSDEREKSFNLLPLILFLINDYFENGLYQNSHLIIEKNGFGEILWEKTVNETYPILSDGTPYYFELKTKKRTYDETDYFRRLHSCIVTLCSRDLKESGLLQLFGLPEVHLTDNELDDFGDTESIKYILQKELNVVFDSRKQLLLQKMYDYVSEATSLLDDDCCTFYGTNSFNLVWQDVCSRILMNQLDVPLSGILNELRESKALFDEYPDDKKTLLDLIDKPVWKKKDSDHGIEAAVTLKPDIVTLHVTVFRDNDKQFKFLIFDAKYYTMTLKDTEVKGQPGVGDVTKQYLYQLAFQPFINKAKITDVVNCFIMPTDENVIINTGTASMKMLDNISSLKPIQIRHIPASIAYDYYLKDRGFDIKQLCLDE